MPFELIVIGGCILLLRIIYLVVAENMNERKR